MSAVLVYKSHRDDNVLVDAIRDNDVPTVLELLDFDPRLVYRSGSGKSLPLLAALHGATDVAEILVRSGASLDIFAASALGKVDHINCLVSLVPSLKQEFNADGWAPLHLSAHFARVAAAEALAAAGADLDAVSRNNFAQTPLHVAAGADAAEVVDLLLSRGANPNARTDEDCTAMHISAHIGSVDIVEQLLLHGADPSAIRRDKATPLTVALLAGQWAVVDLLRSRRVVHGT